MALFDLKVRLLPDKTELTKALKEGQKKSFLGFLGGGNAGGGKELSIKGFGKLIGFAGLTATILGGLSTFLEPIFNLLKYFLIVLFIPLMPYFKSMALKIAEMAKNAKEQQEYSGTFGLGAFASGIGSIFDVSTIGGGIATAFLGAALLGAGPIGKAIALGLAASIVWSNLTEEGASLSNMIENWVILSAVGLLALKLLGIGSIPTFAGAISIALGVSIGIESIKALAGGIEEGDVIEKIKGLFGVGIGGALIGGTIGALVGGPAGALAGAAIGFLLPVSIGLVIEFFVSKSKGKESLMEQTGGLLGFGLPTGILGLILGGKKEEELKMSIPIDANTTEIKNKFLDLAKTSDPLLTNISKTTWENMNNQSEIAINDVISNLSRIPTSITTTHYIRTVKV